MTMPNTLSQEEVYERLITKIEQWKAGSVIQAPHENNEWLKISSFLIQMNFLVNYQSQLTKRISAMYCPDHLANFASAEDLKIFLLQEQNEVTLLQSLIDIPNLNKVFLWLYEILILQETGQSNKSDLARENATKILMEYNPDLEEVLFTSPEASRHDIEIMKRMLCLYEAFQHE